MLRNKQAEGADKKNPLQGGKVNAGENKTLIAVLASHDSPECNDKLARTLEDLAKKSSELLSQYHFIFTGGTFRRIILGTGDPNRAPSDAVVKPVNLATREILLNRCGVTCLPSRSEGGVTVLAHMVTQQSCSIVWPYLTPLTSHWLNPENLALLRLCDQWRVKKLMNPGSVREWFKWEAERDANRNLQPCPPGLLLFKNEYQPPEQKTEKNIAGTWYQHSIPKKSPARTFRPGRIIALVAHNEMKSRMIEFSIDHEQELNQFQHILATGTTGREVAANTRTLHEKIYRYHSGPKGGDIEIATQVLFGRCDAVIFFIDPLTPHPHIEDIRVVLGACMLNEEVRMLTNEIQAREWMRRVIRAQPQPRA